MQEPTKSGKNLLTKAGLMVLVISFPLALFVVIGRKDLPRPAQSGSKAGRLANLSEALDAKTREIRQIDNSIVQSKSEFVKYEALKASQIEELKALYQKVESSISAAADNEKNPGEAPAAAVSMRFRNVKFSHVDGVLQIDTQIENLSDRYIRGGAFVVAEFKGADGRSVMTTSHGKSDWAGATTPEGWRRALAFGVKRAVLKSFRISRPADDDMRLVSLKLVAKDRESGAIVSEEVFKEGAAGTGR